MELLYKEEVFKIVGAGMDVYNELGAGFLEGVYQEALELEFLQRGMPYGSQAAVAISYKGQSLKKLYVPDFIVFGTVLVELKALDRLSGTEEAQLIIYLKATGLRVGVLLNFGRVGELEWKRYVK